LLADLFEDLDRVVGVGHFERLDLAGARSGGLVRLERAGSQRDDLRRRRDAELGNGAAPEDGLRNDQLAGVDPQGGGVGHDAGPQRVSEQRRQVAAPTDMGEQHDLGLDLLGSLFGGGEQPARRGRDGLVVFGEQDFVDALGAE